MANKITWFNLINRFKAEYLLAGETSCVVGADDLDAAVSNLTWFNILNKFKNIVALTNENISSEPFPNTDITFVSLDKKMTEYIEFLLSVEC